MALASGDFFEITISQTNDAAWAALGTQPNIPQAITDAIVNATPIEVYCVDAATGTLVCAEAGLIIGFVDPILTVGAAWPKLTTTADDGSTFVSGLNAAGLWRVYNPQSNTLTTYSLVEQNALKAFLP